MSYWWGKVILTTNWLLYSELGERAEEYDMENCYFYWGGKLQAVNTNTDGTRNPGKLPRAVNEQKVPQGRNRLRYEISPHPPPEAWALCTA
jgi:hypothetical protein